MKSASCRLFVGNLPENVSRSELVDKFKRYGDVESVEIKTKKDPSTDNVISTFAYVNIEANEENLNQCVIMVNGIKWDGRHIKVEQAKESFLQRLQREREASQKNSTHPVPNALVPRISEAPEGKFKKSPIKRELSKKVMSSSSSSSDSSESDNDEPVMHPTCNLPMFRGLKSYSQNNEENQVLKPVKGSKESKKNKSNRPIPEIGQKTLKVQGVASKANLTTSSELHKNSSSDIMQKFESFSDVWKDTDELECPRRLPQKSDRNYSDGASNLKNTDMSVMDQSFNVRNAQRNFSEDVVNKPSIPVSIVHNSAARVAEEKRLKSLEEKRRAFEQQKNAVKLALASTDSLRLNKKVIFDDDDGDDNEPVAPISTCAPPSKKKERWSQDRKDQAKTEKEATKRTGRSKALSLFNDSDDGGDHENDWNTDFNVKKQFEGEKGKKLLELQTGYNNDSRFTLDERFYESDEENGGKSNKDGGEVSQPADDEQNDMAAEREQQLQILSSVLGKPVSTTRPPTTLESKNKGMLRFDPTKPSHVKYELSKEEGEHKKKKKKKGTEMVDEGDEELVEEENETKHKVRREEKDPEPVSKETFYTMADSLAQSLKKAKEGEESGFSLLKMFGPVSDVADKKARQSELDKARPLPKGPLPGKTFLDESSDEENEKESEEFLGPTAAVTSVASSNVGNAKSAGGVWQESFFFQPDDSRLKEGANFFTMNCDVSQATDYSKFSKKREELRRIVKLKLRNNLRQANAFKTKVGDRKRQALRPPFGRMPSKRRRKY